MNTETNAAAAPALRRLPITFTGNGREFFGIWIVNLLLTIVTLGIYSAWAKVRTKRYFNGSTILDGHAFGYHANPIAILKGRIIVVVVLVVYQVLANILPLVALVLIPFYLFALPWIIVRGLAFNAHMTSWRNLRFGFMGRKRDALMAYVVWPLIGLLSFGLLYPFATRAGTRFFAGMPDVKEQKRGHFYGTAKFSADPPAKSYYRGLLYTYGILVIGILLFVLFVNNASNLVSDVLDNPNDRVAPLTLLPFIVLLYIIGGLSLVAYVAVARNVNFRHLALEGGHRFESTITVRGYFWILLSNLVLIAITIGIFIPWAKVRLARYLAENTFVLAHGDLDSFVADIQPDGGVASGEFLDIEGLDFGL